MVRRVGSCALNTKGQQMNLRYITCSDPREFNDIHDIVALAHTSPRAEIAVQAHPSKMSSGMPRNEWFRELLQYVQQDHIDINLAMHVNREWCDEICRTGKIPTELKDFFGLSNDVNKKPLIKRWQLNIPHDTARNVNIKALAQLIECASKRDFIIQYGGHTKHIAAQLFCCNNIRFSLLYDASGGRGISPDCWQKPVFPCVPQGYSGGLSPENVENNLSEIARVQKWPRDDIWIDAEGKLKTDDKFDINRARQYILNAEHWLQNQKQK